MKIERYCNKCELTTEHDHQEDIDGDTKTTIDVCTICGNADVDIDSYDEDFESLDYCTECFMPHKMCKCGYEEIE
jgi:hypothetical protein